MKPPAFWFRQPGLVARLLSPLGTLYGMMTLRRMAQPGIVADVPVICIGNFTLGGAGKTPTAIALGKALTAAGEKPVFLTRGYGGRTSGPLLVSDQSTADQVGDEPLLLARIAPTIVARDRPAGLPLAKAADATVILLDDGMQNPALAKTFVLAVMDGTGGFGNNLPFPAGPLRAPVESQAAYADALLDLDNSGPMSAQAYAGYIGKPVYTATVTVPQEIALTMRKRRVFGFAGIGRPGKLFETLRDIGCDLAGTASFADHHRYTDTEAVELMARAKALRAELVTTEKDHVRLAGTPALDALAKATLVLPVGLKLPEPLLAAVKSALSDFRARA